MKKLLLCLLVVFCLVGCTVENTQTTILLKNKTEKIQTGSIFSTVDGNIICSYEIEPYNQKSLTLDNAFFIHVNTIEDFNEKFVCYSTQNNTWVIDFAQKTTYTIYSELSFDVTLQNFSIVNGAKSSPCYSVVVPCASNISTTTIDVYQKWLGNIWDLENRNISSINDYNNKLLQSVVVDGVTYYYEIVVEGTNIYIRNR